MGRHSVKFTTERRFTARELAEAFCELDDEAQAQFFIECAAIASTWCSTPTSMNLGADWQWYLVGKHLATCACSNDDARDMVREIARAARGEGP